MSGAWKFQARGESGKPRARRCQNCAQWQGEEDDWYLSDSYGLLRECGFTGNSDSPSDFDAVDVGHGRGVVMTGPNFSCCHWTAGR